MKQKPLFIVKALLLSLLLFTVWYWSSGVYSHVLASVVSAIRKLFGATPLMYYKDKYSYYLIPGLALIMSAPSVSITKKIRYVSLSVACLIGYQIFSLTSGMAGLVKDPGSAGSFLGMAATLIDHSFGPVLPLFAVLLFFNDTINKLWGGQVTTSSSLELRRCPICGQAKTGLHDHIKAVHGEKSLKEPRVLRALGEAKT